ncbi:LysR family transcriptional regulator [Pseudomonas sp. CAU 1711]|uniref:LysR family transcriptional regulator n=1 Tax=Pseudomonas sp. CAU 1711 TaxID=3140356 RepID=UPI0032606B35
MDWDNLRFFLELSRAGKLAVAARRLEVDHSTVSRRIQALENSLGQQLFLRGASGFSLTEAGRNLLPRAEAMESACIDIDRVREGPGEGLSGVVRIGVPEGYGVNVLASQLALFNRQHPNLCFDLLAAPRMLQLSRREADIVITLERPVRGPYLVTRLTDYQLCLYASPQYLSGRPPIRSAEDLRELAFVSYVDDLLYSKELQYLDELGKPAHIPLRSTSILAQQQAVAAGVGLGILPAFSADSDPRLVRVLGDQVVFTRTFWMLMPAELKDIARMKATWDYLRESAQAQQTRLLG